MKKQINCPVSVYKVDENAIRAASFLTVIFLLTGILYNSYLLVLLLGFDFGLRAFTTGKYSFIRAISKSIIRYLKIKQKPIDAAQKKFAAGLGMTFSIIIGIFMYSGNFILTYVFSTVLIICALLEGIMAFCIGCYIYTMIVTPFYKPGQVES